jgi:hypothetical protein
MADPEEEGPRETEPVLVPEPKPTRSVAATVTDVPWLADVEQMRKRVLAEAESLRGEARGHYENLSNQAREKLEEAVWEASSLAGLQSQSAETLSLLTKDNIERKFKGSAEEVARWQAQVVRSVEDRVLAEFESFVDELEPSLHQSGRMMTESALGFVRFTRAPAKDAIQEARKTGDAEKSSRLERFETTILKPMLKPVQRGMKEPLMERAPYVAGGVVAYGLACGFIGAWLCKRGGGGRGGSSGGESNV